METSCSFIKIWGDGVICCGSGDGKLKFRIVVGFKGGAWEGNCAAIVGGMFGAADKAHVLADAKEGDIEGGNIDHIVEADLGSRRDDHFDAANTGYGAVRGAITKGDKRCRVVIWPHGIKEVAGVDHVSVSAAIHDEHGGTPVAMPM